MGWGNVYNPDHAYPVKLLIIDNLNDLDISAFRPKDWLGLDLGVDVTGQDP